MIYTGIDLRPLYTNISCLFYGSVPISEIDDFRDDVGFDFKTDFLPLIFYATNGGNYDWDRLNKHYSRKFEYRKVDIWEFLDKANAIIVEYLSQMIYPNQIETLSEYAISHDIYINTGWHITLANKCYWDIAVQGYYGEMDGLNPPFDLRRFNYVQSTTLASSYAST